MRFWKRCLSAVATVSLAFSVVSAEVKVTDEGSNPTDTKYLQAHFKAGRVKSFRGDWIMGTHHGTTEAWGDVKYAQKKNYDYSPGNFFTTTTDGEWKPGSDSDPTPFQNGQKTNFRVSYDAINGTFEMALKKSDNSDQVVTWQNENFTMDVNKDLPINKLGIGIRLRTEDGNYGWKIALSNLTFTSDAGNTTVEDMSISHANSESFLEKSIVTDDASMGSFSLVGDFTPSWNGTGANDFGKNNFFQVFVSASNSDVPEPTCLILLSAGALGLIRRKRKKLA